MQSCQRSHLLSGRNRNLSGQQYPARILSQGQTPILVENKRAHYSCGTLCSAINAQGKVFFMLKPYKAGANNGFNSSDFLDFLKGLLADQKKLQGIPPGSKGRKLFVICDNHRMHKTKLGRSHECCEVALFFLKISFSHRPFLFDFV